MLPYALFSAFLLLVCGVLWWRTRWLWNQRRESSEGAEREFYRRQYRRRTTVNLLIGLVGITVFATYWIGNPVALGLVLLVISLTVGVIVVLAGVDAWQSNRYFTEAYRQQLIERAKLQAEYDRIQQARSNGKRRHRD